ncbi:acireductone synthase [Candidatus Pacearchaeota archaeon]|nr:acireductone synthase [Candidatus Pacearchaeota archaeon]
MGSLDLSIKELLFDVEGVTTPISFVHEKLFPYARERVKLFLAQNVEDPMVRKIISDFRVGYAIERNGAVLDSSPEAVGDYALELMAQDKKFGPLKELQGMIWKEGYESGKIVGEVFADVPPAFRRVAEKGLGIRIFSSGSVQAQQLLFCHSNFGDLTQFIRGYFDTQTAGQKNVFGSYTRIANAAARSSRNILFLSDVVTELDAAKAAGMQVTLCLRPGNKPQPDHDYRTISNFDELSS